MHKVEFLRKLSEGLCQLPEEDKKERLAFYSEMLDDYMEEGLEEEVAVCRVGSVDDLIADILSNYDHKKKASRIRPVGEIVLLVLGSPIWLSLLIAVLSVAFSLYVVLWSVIASLWAIFAAFIACAISGIIVGIVFIVSASLPSGIAVIGAGFICAGLSILMFFGCKYATRGSAYFTKASILWIKRMLAKKEGRNE